MDKSKNYYKEKAQRVIEYANILSKNLKLRKKRRRKDARKLKKAHEEWKTRRFILSP